MATLKEKIVQSLETMRVRNQIHLITSFSSVGLIISILVLTLLGITLKNYLQLQDELLNAERQLVEVRSNHTVLQSDMQEFIRRPSSIKAKGFLQKINELEKQALELTNFGSSSKTDDSLDVVQKKLKLYRDSFSFLWEKFQTLGLGLDKGLQRDLNLGAGQLKNELTSLGDQALEIALLDIRQNEKNYFLSNQPILLVEMKRLYDRFLKMLSKSQLVNADKARIRTLMVEYYSMFVQASYINADVQQAKLDLEASHDALAENLVEWMLVLRDDLSSIETQAEERIELFIALLVTTAVLVGLLVFLTGRFVSQTISNPIIEVVTSLKELAGGNRESNIPYKDLKNEVGEIAEAAEVFKDSLYEAEKGAVAEAKRQALEESNQALETKVEERTKQLASANEELQEAVEKLKLAQSELLEREKLAALGSLVAGVSHELNTPLGNALTVLTSIDDQRSMLSRAVNDGTLTQGQMKEYLKHTAMGLEMAERNLSHASGLVKNFKQVAVDQTSESRRKFNLKEVTCEVLETLKPSYKQKDFEFVVEMPDDLMMDSYPGPYGQVISNFINNACIHGFDERPYGSVLITGKQDGDHVKVIVSDDGKGMPESVQQKVFEPFFTTKLGQGGSGLGMNICYNLIAGVLGGKVEVFSAEGKGTQVDLQLPLVAPESAATDEAMAFGR